MSCDPAAISEIMSGLALIVLIVAAAIVIIKVMA